MGLDGSVAIKGKSLKRMQTAAAEMKADALIGYYEDAEKLVTGANWASALAVRFVDGSQPPIRSVGNFQIAIPHPLLDDKTKKESKEGERADLWSRKLSQMILAQKGYYAVLVDEPIHENFADALGNLDVAGLNRYGGADSDLILGLQFVDKSKSTVILMSAESNTIEAALYSKNAQKVTWQNMGSGSATVGWMINLVPGAKKVLSIRVALEEAFKTLPDISTETKKK